MVKLKDGREMSFLEITGLPEKEKEEVLGQMTRLHKVNFLQFESEAAIIE